jgi:hypothetical protein
LVPVEQPDVGHAGGCGKERLREERGFVGRPAHPGLEQSEEWAERAKWAHWVKWAWWAQWAQCSGPRIKSIEKFMVILELASNQSLARLIGQARDSHLQVIEFRRFVFGEVLKHHPRSIPGLNSDAKLFKNGINFGNWISLMAGPKITIATGNLGRFG